MQFKEFPPLKPSLSVEKQIDLLQNRGLIIENRDSSQLLIRDNNYYRLNWYFKCFMDKNNNYPPGVSFDQIFNIYLNDHWFRKNLFPMLELFEIKLKSNIAYYLGQKYGPDSFYKPNLYQNDQIYLDCRRILALRIWDRALKGDSVAIHHRQHYAAVFRSG